jgi:hypothetical protein
MTTELYVLLFALAEYLELLLTEDLFVLTPVEFEI